MSGRRAKTLTRRRRSVPASSSALQVSVPPLNRVRNDYATPATTSIATTAWIDEDLDQGDTSDAAAVEGASDQQKLRAMEATLSGQVNSKMQERRDDAPTKGRVSIVLRALSEPDLLVPEEVDVLVRVVLWKAIHDDDSAEPAAKFCTRVIRAELDGGFVDQLLWTCRKWLKQHDVPVQSSTFLAPLEPKTQKNAGQKLIAFGNFMAALLSDVPENSGAASMGSLYCGHIFSMAALLCDSCRLVMNSPQLDYEAKVECLRRALTTAGEAAERGAPARMAALVDCLRDAFLSSDVPEEARLTLLELLELRASGWKLSLQQQLYYSSLNDAAGDEYGNNQNLSLLPCCAAE
ncbi:MIF4G domain-containing protein A-like [Rhipicephalus microplus]|uniref:MIF4G domain-containing protein A-like n=1 Tax=Rhipicephalus microplus TaxID=6941 RepID=UPI003F6A7DDB